MSQGYYSGGSFLAKRFLTFFFFYVVMKSAHSLSVVASGSQVTGEGVVIWFAFASKVPLFLLTQNKNPQT